MLYQSGGKLGPHEHLGADIPTIVEFPKSKNWIKLKKSLFEKKRLQCEVPTTYTNLYTKFDLNRVRNLAQKSN